MVVALSNNGILKSYAYSNGGVAVLDISNISNSPGTLDMVISGTFLLVTASCNCKIGFNTYWQNARGIFSL